MYSVNGIIIIIATVAMTRKQAAMGTKLFLTAVWASLVDCTSSRHLLKAQHCSLSPNGCSTPPSVPHRPPTHPPIHDITGAEKTHQKNQQHPK